MLTLLVTFQAFCCIAQKEYPCMGGNCENGFGKKKLNDSYVYIGYFVNGERSGIGVSYSIAEDKANLFTSKEDKPYGMSISLSMNESSLNLIQVTELKGNTLYPKLEIQYGGEATKFYARRYSDSREKLVRNGRGGSSKNDDSRCKENDKVTRCISYYYLSSLHHKFKMGNSSNRVFIELEKSSIKLVPDDVEKDHYQTAYTWDEKGITIENKALNQKLRILNPKTFVLYPKRAKIKYMAPNGDEFMFIGF